MIHMTNQRKMKMNTMTEIVIKKAIGMAKRMMIKIMVWKMQTLIRN